MGKKEEQEMHRDERIEQTGQLTLTDNKEETSIHLLTIIGDLLKEGKMKVEVRKSHDEWFGVTYKEDKPDVVASIQKLITDGVYPEKLF